MNFIKQIGNEIKNIFRSKFLLIIGILVLAGSVLAPIAGLFVPMNGPIFPGPGPMPLMEKVMYARAAAFDGKIGYPGEFSGDPITVNGVTIAPDNPFYWQISSAMQEKAAMEADKGRFSAPDVLDLALSLMDAEIAYYVRFAQSITKPQDYRTELAWRGTESLYDKFILEHGDVTEDKLMEAVSIRRGMDPVEFKKKYIDITPEQRLAAIDKADTFLNTLYEVVKNDDFPKYIDLRIQQENDQITSLNDQIAIQEKAIIDNPDQEENISRIIEDLRKQIRFIEENNIPVLQYRLQKNIKPFEDIWQNNALGDVESSRNQLLYTVILSEEDFNKPENQYLVQQYGTYQKYVATTQKQIDELNNNIIIAQKSLDGDKPDMKYVFNGARNATVRFLDYSIFVALFAVLLGGWIMASEFQQGTIRLLMIRPKTRIKILMSKFIAAIALCIALYIVGSLLNIATNGVLLGFSDYAYPNYTVAGEINFFAYYFPQMLACFIPIVFGYTVAFMLSVIVKNIAVSIAIPIVSFVLCSVLMSFFSYSSIMEWVAFTPVPFVQLSSFFVPYSNVQQIIQRGVPLSLTYGIIMLLVLSAICTAISVLVFRKRDITN